MPAVRITAWLSVLPITSDRGVVFVATTKSEQVSALLLECSHDLRKKLIRTHAQGKPQSNKEVPTKFAFTALHPRERHAINVRRFSHLFRVIPRSAQIARTRLARMLSISSCDMLENFVSSVCRQSSAATHVTIETAESTIACGKMRVQRRLLPNRCQPCKCCKVPLVMRSNVIPKCRSSSVARPDSKLAQRFREFLFEKSGKLIEQTTGASFR